MSRTDDRTAAHTIKYFARLLAIFSRDEGIREIAFMIGQAAQRILDILNKETTK